MTLKLEVFEAPSQRSEIVVMKSDEVEDARLQAYENGYAAGWEDAMSAASDEQGKLSAELANNLQHLAFTHEEARSHLLKSIRPTLVEITTRLLPELAREALAPSILDALLPIIDEAADQPVLLSLNPAARPSIERLISFAAGVPVAIEEEATLGEGQVYLKVGGVEHRVDLDQAVQQIIRAVQDFFDHSERGSPDGQEQ